MPRQLGNQAIEEVVGLRLQHRLEAIADLGDERPAPRLGGLAQDRHPFHEELVEVRREDREKLGAFEQRRAIVESFGEHPPVEFDPAQVPIDPDSCERRLLSRGWQRLVRGRRICHQFLGHRRAPGFGSEEFYTTSL